MRKIKRFYKDATVVAAADGFAVRLDGKPIKTPAGHPLAVPAAALAEEIAGEWRAQDAEVRPETMPLTQLASTALDRVGPERTAILAQLLGYGGTDLLCYRATDPADLVERQKEAWQPLLDWAARELDAPLAVTQGVLAVDQPPETLAALARHLDGYDTWRLTALQAATAATGSLVLGLALVQGRLSAADAFARAQVDETFQIEKWGDDAEAADRRAALARDVTAAERLLALLS
ncbi:MAG: ATP12 family chaperone protein [Actinomycetota bacterium]